MPCEGRADRGEVFVSIDWEAFDDACANLRSILEACPCWYCGSPMGAVEPLYMDGTWACHPVCAPKARAEFGMKISMSVEDDSP